MNNDIRLFDRRVNFIINDTVRILELSKSSVLLREFDQSIGLLNFYLDEMATLDKAMKRLIVTLLMRRPITPEEEIVYKAFVAKCEGVIVELKKAIETVGKRRLIIVKISDVLKKRSNGKTEKKLSKVSTAKRSPKNATRKIVIQKSSDKIEKDINKAAVELQKDKLKMEKEREQQAKILAKEREKMEKEREKMAKAQEKLLAKEREKLEKEREKMAKEQEKLLAKEREKQEKLLAKEREKQEKLLAKEREKQAKVATKEPEKMLVKEKATAIKTQAAPATNEQLLKDRVATFVFKKAEFQSLSNFWPCLVTIFDGEDVYQYSSGEHAFHGEKYRRLAKHSENASRKAELLDYSKQFMRCYDGGMSALDAKRKGGKGGLRLTKPELKLWDRLSLDVQREISTWKVNNNPTVRQDLLNTGNRILVHSAMRTSEKEMAKKYWEGKAVVTEKGDIEVLGGNWLGKIWMEVREQIQSGR